MNRLLRLFARKNALLFFVKHGESDSVKSRLGSVIGEGAASALYRCFIMDMMRVFSKFGARLYVFHYPPGARAEVKRLLKQRRVYPQEGNDLGERMWNALAYAFGRGHRKAVLTGSDIPELSAEILKEAFSALDDHEAVLGPSEDGGYYCIGFREGSVRSEFFRGIRWSNPGVFQATAKKIIDAGLRLHILPGLSDIDTIYDLRKYFERSIKSGRTGTKTMKHLIASKEGL